MKDRKLANTDTTYCTSILCRRCWRNAENWIFEKDKMYIFQDRCINPEFAVNVPVNEEERNAN